MSEQIEELGFGADVKTALRTLIETCERFADKLEEQDKAIAAAEASQPSEPWKPTRNESDFWFVDSDGKAEADNWSGGSYDNNRYNLGNCFQTELEAKRHAAKMRFMFRRCPEIEPGTSYYTISHTGILFVSNYSMEPVDSRRAHGNTYKTCEEAQEWQPLYKFAFLGGDCPEGF